MTLKSLLTIVFCLLPGALLGQSNCASRDAIVSKLQSNYGEGFAGGGMRNAQQLFEVWFSPDKGTWTILLTRADGVACIMAAGTNWREGTTITSLPRGIPG